MLTGMTEQDWLIVLAVFDAAQSSRGEPGHDDRKFREGFHYFRVHSITWRALPRELGKWNSVWKRFWRLSRSGVFEAFFQLLAECSETAHLIQFFDSTTARAHVSAAGAKGAASPGTRPLARRLSTKIHLKTDLDGRPLDFHLTRGEVSDSTQFETSLDIGPDIRPRIAVTDKGYDSDANRIAAIARGITPVILVAKTPGSEVASFLSVSINSGRASNRQSASSSGSNVSPCAAKRPTSVIQPSSVSHVG